MIFSDTNDNIVMMILKELVKKNQTSLHNFNLFQNQSDYLELFYVAVNDNSTVNYEVSLVTFYQTNIVVKVGQAQNQRVPSVCPIREPRGHQ